MEDLLFRAYGAYIWLIWAIIGAPPPPPSPPPPPWYPPPPVVHGGFWVPEKLQDASAQEVKAGYLEGPFTESQVGDLLGHDGWGAVRRFAVVQGSGPDQKTRPIDDGHESQINSAYTATMKLDLQSSEYVASLALFLAELEPPLAWFMVCGSWVCGLGV